MSDFILSCSSTVDLTLQHLEDRDIKYIPFHFFVDGKEYTDNFGLSIPHAEFYKAMENGAQTRTSQPNVDEYINFFTPFLENGQDVLHIELSSGLSGAYNTACIARAELSDRYPKRKIMIVDSLGASSGYGLFIDRVADLRDSGYDIDRLCAWAQEHKLEVHHWFFSTDLSYYVKGGRISKVAGWVGTMLKICPLLNMDAEGTLVPRQKVRTKERVIRELVSRMEQFAADGLAYSGKSYICHSACLPDAKAVAALIKERFPKLSCDPRIFPIGTTIGSHTGPGTVSLFFWGTKRFEG